MYNVSVGPSKIVAKTRRGINQNMERIDNYRDHNKRQGEQMEQNSANGPKPVFHTNQRKSGSSKQQEPAASPQQEELVRFVSETWNNIQSDYEHHVRNNTTGPETVVYYEEKGPNQVLQDFKPFDFEAWWGRRLFNNITKSVP